MISKSEVIAIGRKYPWLEKYMEIEMIKEFRIIPMNEKFLDENLLGNSILQISGKEVYLVDCNGDLLANAGEEKGIFFFFGLHHSATVREALDELSEEKLDRICYAVSIRNRDLTLYEFPPK